MKAKITVILCLLLLSCLLLTACSNNDKEGETALNTIDSDSTGYSTNDETENNDVTYKVTEKDGKYYLNFSDGNSNYDVKSYEDKLPGHISDRFGGAIAFDTVDDFIDALESNNKLTEYQTICIKMFFEKDENGIIICNPNGLFEPYVPFNILRQDFTWYGETYSYVYGFGDSLSFLELETKTKQSFDYLYNSLFTDYWTDHSIQINSKQDIEERNATVYEYCFSNHNTELKTIQYVLENENKTLFVSESYSSVTDIVPEEIQILGEENGIYYWGRLTKLEDRPTEEWLMSIGMQPKK